jgi:alkanesulfonate monooxygenase SsuD/methylene tetrahydromethanopterin reductase-like flavin-dependent oxidoreductase (luciferase family)
MDDLWAPTEQAHVDRMTRVSVVGSPDSVRRGLESLIAATQADELILTGQIFDHAARLRSFEIVAGLREQPAAKRPDAADAAARPDRPPAAR